MSTARRASGARDPRPGGPRTHTTPLGARESRRRSPAARAGATPPHPPQTNKRTWRRGWRWRGRRGRWERPGGGGSSGGLGGGRGGKRTACALEGRRTPARGGGQADDGDGGAVGGPRRPARRRCCCRCYRCCRFAESLAADVGGGHTQNQCTHVMAAEGVGVDCVGRLCARAARACRCTHTRSQRHEPHRGCALTRAGGCVPWKRERGGDVHANDTGACEAAAAAAHPYWHVHIVDVKVSAPRWAAPSWMPPVASSCRKNPNSLCRGGARRGRRGM